MKERVKEIAHAIIEQITEDGTYTFDDGYAYVEYEARTETYEEKETGYKELVITDCSIHSAMFYDEIRDKETFFTGYLQEAIWEAINVH